MARYRIRRLSHCYSAVELGWNYLIEVQNQGIYSVDGKIVFFVTLPQAKKAKRRLIQQDKEKK